MAIHTQHMCIQYKKRIKESRISDNGGAGLGLIDIVKKTKNQIEFDVKPMADNTSFVILMSKVNRD